MLIPTGRLNSSFSNLFAIFSHPSFLRPYHTTSPFDFFNLHRRGFSFPLHGSPVIDPTSAWPNPTDLITLVNSAFLSKPAASPIGFSNFIPKISS